MINNTDEVRFTLRLNKTLYKQIIDKAVRNKRSRNKEIEFMLEEHLKIKKEN